MTTPEALNALADRVEREEPSRELDSAIENLLAGGSEADLAYVLQNIDIATKPPAYTTSLDAAVTLVPEGAWREQSGPRRYLNIPVPSPNYWRCEVTTWSPMTASVGWGATEPLAVCAAALRARASLTEKE